MTTVLFSTRLCEAFTLKIRMVMNANKSQVTNVFIQVLMGYRPDVLMTQVMESQVINEMDIFSSFKRFF